jgi:hypothetical protein
MVNVCLTRLGAMLSRPICIEKPPCCILPVMRSECSAFSFSTPPWAVRFLPTSSSAVCAESRPAKAIPIVILVK